MIYAHGSKSFIVISLMLFVTFSLLICNKVKEKKMELLKYKAQYELISNINEEANKKIVQEYRYEIF